MMVSLRKTSLGLSVLFVTACSGSSDPAPSPSPASTERQRVAEDERSAVGPGNPSDQYCVAAGFTPRDQLCVFADGTSCEKFSFYQGRCGQEHSYCQAHGGKISSREEDKGGWTAIYAVCDLAGKQCTEDTFFRTGKCE